jgi:hypothetical protein
LELGTAYLGGEMLSALKGPAGKGLIYQRTDMNGEIQPYIGQAKSMEHFDQRVYDHNTTYPNADFKYEFLQQGIAPGTPLDVAEETWIRNMGGPTNLKNSEGMLSNKRVQMNDEAYRAAGGTAPDPYSK